MQMHQCLKEFLQRCRSVLTVCFREHFTTTTISDFLGNAEKEEHQTGFPRIQSFLFLLILEKPEHRNLQGLRILCSELRGSGKEITLSRLLKLLVSYWFAGPPVKIDLSVFISLHLCRQKKPERPPQWHCNAPCRTCLVSLSDEKNRS